MGNRLRIYNHVNRLFGEGILGRKAEIRYEQSGAYRGKPSFTSGSIMEFGKSEIILENDGHPEKHILLESIITLSVYLDGENYPRTIYHKGRVIKRETNKNLS